MGYGLFSLYIGCKGSDVCCIYFVYFESLRGFFCFVVCGLDKGLWEMGYGLMGGLWLGAIICKFAMETEDLC